MLEKATYGLKLTTSTPQNVHVCVVDPNEHTFNCGVPIDVSPVLVANSLKKSMNGRSVWARSLRMSSVRSIWARGIILKIQVREDLGTDQGPDTLDVFVMNSEGCEDTHQPVRGGCECWGARSKGVITWRIQSLMSEIFFPGGYLTKDSETVCSVVNDSWTATTTESLLTPPASRLSGNISMSNFLDRIK